MVVSMPQSSRPPLENAKQKRQSDKIRYLEDRIARAVVIDHDAGAQEHITFGATVTAKNLTTGREVEYTLVSPDGMDPMNGKISYTSPIGKALIGKGRGDQVEIKTPDLLEIGIL